ncbi:TonB-dependent receptor [Fulvivirga kasyanovii]|uniref:TonB-dependent receptor n=1 Tax=Fulvivirga kasyanovii TaxID=396812 RepID=A0ABW9RUJ0_9BACT|nr:TonB-dependent receptor [Fulvivirga kasyanovii]MTI27857.1 TonB-dependent receptor [Fulvivirga kasyanovii]
MKRIILIAFICLGVLQYSYSQTKITGKVSSEEGETLPGVSVVVKGTTQGTVTDIDGSYNISVPPDASTLVFSFVGMNTQEVSINGKSVIDVQMSADIKQLSEVVIVGYGTQKKKDITSAVSTIDTDEIQNVPASYSFDGAIQGKTAGLNVSSSSATPGSAINVNIRGVTSINASSQPLYVVDGVPIVTGNNSALNSNIQPINPLADINPNDIESISVLKDASAAAIYGSRGANGVIIITSKRGTAGKTKFNVGYYTGISEISNTPELMTSQEWISFMNAAAEFDGLGENYWNSSLGDPNDESIPTYNAYDYIFRTGVTHNADVSIQGGNDNTKFYISGNYFNQEGIQVGQNFERISGRINLDHSASSKLGLGTSILVSRTNHQRTVNENDEYGVVINAQAWDPTAPLTQDDGSYTDPFKHYGWWALENPLFIAEQYINTSATSRALTSVFATYDFTDKLSFKTTWSVDYNSLTDESFIPAGSKESDVGNGIYGTYEELAWLNENTLTYNLQLNDDHQFNFLAGFTMQESRQDFSTITGTGFPSNDVIKISTAANSTGSSNSSSFGFLSYLGRVNYSFKGKYLANFTVRSDGSSRFGTNTRYGTFPSGSVGWVISEESFLSSSPVLSNLKLRASYGTIGNAGIGNFTWRGAYSLGAAYNGSGGTAPAILENPDLSWEKTTQLNIGVDVGLFKDRVSLTADYFTKNTTDLLLEKDVPGTTGFKTTQSNFGEIENRGFEVSLNATVLRKQDFEWSTNINFSHIENEVVDVLNDGQIVSRNFVILEGEALSQLYLIKFLGVDPFTGDAVFEDINSDGIINLDDRQPVGSGIPNYFGGFSNTFRYKGLSLDVFFQFSGGNKIYNQSRHAYENYGSLQSGIPYGNQSKNSLDYWKQPGDITDIPRPSLAGPGDADAQWQRFSTQYLEDGDFVRLKNVKLAYNIPSSLIEKWGLSSVQVYAQGRNLITWTDYLGFDPEVSTNTSGTEELNSLQGEDFGTLGQARTYSFGINIGF